MPPMICLNSILMPIALAGFLLIGMRPAEAAVGPENVIVVVNEASADSITVANHFVDLRQIPVANVIVISEVPEGLTIGLGEFRDEILKPLLAAIDKRKLGAQTKVIAYSAGFPTSVRINEHTGRLTTDAQKKFQTPVASINSLTFFFRNILADDPGYLDWNSNWYARNEFDNFFKNVLSAPHRGQLEIAIASYEAENWTAAGIGYETLCDAYPTLSGLAIRRAQCAAAAGETADAVTWLRRAVSVGWRSGRYIRNDVHLKRLLDDDTSVAALVDRLQDAPTDYQWATRFMATNSWVPNGEAAPLTSGGASYLMSCVLAVVHPNGSTLEQATEVLRRASTVQRRSPKGAVFGFSKTGDVRTTTRFPGVPAAMVALVSQGATPDLFRSVLPTTDKTYFGIQLGAASFSTEKRKWKFAPGAIAENLTSLGGVFQSKSQTRLTELLHAGAAISSGAVAEPYSIQHKFPHPMMYSHYASGASAIEAFYLSVTSPYQLLIVGDPLCTPFARPPSDLVTMRLDKPGGRQLICTRSKLAGVPMTTAVQSVEFFMGGRLVQTTRPFETVNVNLPAEGIGVSEFKVVLVGDDAVESRAPFAQTFEFGDVSKMPICELAEPDFGDDLSVKLSCPGATSIAVRHFGRLVGTVDGESGVVNVPRSRVGQGPVKLTPVATLAGRTLDGLPFVDVANKAAVDQTP